MSEVLERPIQGGCYCGKVRYEVARKEVLRAQCHCRVCQMYSGGGPNYFMLVPKIGFRYIKGEAKEYENPTKQLAVTRSFCADCGTHLISTRPGLEEIVLKVGSLDDPSYYKGPAIAVFTAEEQTFHMVPAGTPSFGGLPE